MMRDKQQYIDQANRIAHIAADYVFDTSHEQLPSVIGANQVAEGLLEKAPDKGQSLDHVLNQLSAYVVEGCLGISNPRFLGYILTRPVAESHSFDILANALHASPGAAHLAPSATVVERIVLSWLAAEHGIENHQGLFVSGGSEANLIGLKCARDSKMSRTDGVRNSHVLYSTEDAHYSMARAWDIIGCGSGNVRDFTPADPSHLEDAIREDIGNGRVPTSISCAFGTTNSGEIEISDGLIEIARKYNLWLHIDGSYGLPVLMLDEYKSWLPMIREADSIAMDTHKWIGGPMGTGAVFLRGLDLFFDSFSFSAVFTDHQTFEVPLPDQCQMGIQGTRPFHALRLWGAFKLMGFDEIRSRIATTLDVARFMARRLERSPCLELLSPPRLSVLNFTYPAAAIDDIRSISEALAQDNIVFLTATKYQGRACFRAAIISSVTTPELVDDIISRIEERVAEAATG